MNVANSVLWRMAIILKANKVNLFVSSVLFFSGTIHPNFLDTPHINHLEPNVHYSGRTAQLTSRLRI
jgi:hypothetical protein